ncbi:piggyBac transposable element-derived protein 3-like [Acanthopagrus latus]|uniref:piggyBac transposable element-derived protein 3-like n=1 Tax=Acanthopagrus latus TaxID=8177 RepID=UPI00187CA9A8|nr:piggyBac transposable element-derived protein 3-like [Acanthopagrus latus]
MAKRKFSTEDVLRFLDGNVSEIEDLIETEDEVEDKTWTPGSSSSSNEGGENIDQRTETEEADPTVTQATKRLGRGKVKRKEKRKKTHTAESDDSTSSEVETSTATHTKRTKKSAKKKKKKRDYRWRKVDFESPDVQFDDSADETIEERSEFTPYMYFKQFVTNEMLQLVVDQTNLYSVQKDGKSINKTVKEIEQVLGMYMLMGLVQMPNVRAYWEMDTRYPKVADVMSWDRFQKLLTLLHFEDNLGVTEDAMKDKIWKVRPWLEKLRQQCLQIHPEENHAVDEIIVPFKGKSQLKVYMPGKPHKWGFKMWGRAGQSGFLYDFDICQGPADPKKEKSDVGVSGDVVLKLTSTLRAGKNYKVFADNYFTNYLREREIYYVGTVRMKRVKNCKMMEEKDLKAQGRGSMDHRVNQNGMIIVRWCDNKAVNLVSSFVGITPQSEVKRWDRKTKNYLMVPRPGIVETYNRFMGGVDLLDMLSALYKYSLKSRQWYLHIWWHSVTVALINAWILYRRDLKAQGREKDAMPLRRFQASVGSCLISAGKARVKPGRPLSSPSQSTMEEAGGKCASRCEARWSQALPILGTATKVQALQRFSTLHSHVL